VAGSLYKLAGMRAAVAWVTGTACDIVTPPSPATSGLTATLGSGQGAQFTGASTLNPFIAYHSVLNEKVYVTGVAGDIITFVRAKDGTTAATWVAGTAVLIPFRPIILPLANRLDLNANIVTLQFNGDGSVERLYLPNGLTGVLGTDKFAMDMLQYVAGITPVTVGVGIRSDEASRWYLEQGAYPNVQIDAYYKATRDDQQGQFTRVRVTIPSAKLQAVFLPSNAGNNAVQNVILNWSALGVTKDLMGQTLPGLTGSPPTPQEIYLSELVNAAP
jgi:hypothetical protein